MAAAGSEIAPVDYGGSGGSNEATNEGADIEAETQKDLHNKKMSAASKKHLPIAYFQGLDLDNLLKPIQSKIEEISDFFSFISHPNNPGIGFIGPANIFEKLKEKKEYFFPSGHVAIFGGRPDLHDYPFAYRDNGFTKTEKR